MRQSTNKNVFSGAAASAFGKREKHVPSYVPPSRFSSALDALSVQDAAFTKEKERGNDKIRFDTTAASAFGKKRGDATVNNGFDSNASSAFGKSRGDQADGNNGFGDAAASAFGKKPVKEKRPVEPERPGLVLEKSNTLWAHLAGILPEEPKKREWASSAISQKKKQLEETVSAMAAEKVSDVTNMELFPALVSKPIAAASLSGAKPSFAEIMRMSKEKATSSSSSSKNPAEERPLKKGLMACEEYEERPIRLSMHNYNYIASEDSPNTYDENDLEYVHPSERPARAYTRKEEEYSSEEEEEDVSASW